MALTRKPITAGQFYPADKTELGDEIKKYLGKEKKQYAKGAIVPHAGYMFSGKLAGEVFGKINEKKDFIILGVNHSGLGNKISFSSLNFETPLGIVKNNSALGDKILKKIKKAIDAEINEQAHNYEHSIEVQLPFLQISQKRFEIVPILLKDLSCDECCTVAEILSEFIDENVALIVSSDFTHYGENYGFVPFTKDIRKNLYSLDNEIIINILNKNSKKVYELAGKSTICGIYGITIVTEIAKIKRWKGKLVDYYTSGDVVGYEEGVAVGYAGLIFV